MNTVIANHSSRTKRIMAAISRIPELTPLVKESRGFTILIFSFNFVFGLLLLKDIYQENQKLSCNFLRLVSFWGLVVSVVLAHSRYRIIAKLILCYDHSF